MTSTSISKKHYFENTVFNYNQPKNITTSFKNEKLNFSNETNLESLDTYKNDDFHEKWVKVAWQNLDIPLMPGDSIIVKESTGTVNVIGAVYNPGLIGYQKNKTLNYYINSAGGINPLGNKKDIVVVYANGVIIPKKLIRMPIIKDGSTIVVNEKEFKEAFSFTEFSSSLLSIISTTVTILVLSQQLNQ